MTEQTTATRKTALIVGAFLVCAGAWNVHRHRPGLAYSLLGIGAILLVIGLFIPALALRFHNLWMRFAAALGYVNSRILLTGVHFVVFTPVGFLVKIFGHDPLQLRAQPATSYWIPRPATRQTKEGFRQLF